MYVWFIWSGDVVMLSDTEFDLSIHLSYGDVKAKSTKLSQVL